MRERMKDLAFGIKDDKSLWVRMDLEGVGKCLIIEEDYYDGIVEDLIKQKEQFAAVIAKNLVAWDNSRDKKEESLPEIYLTNKILYKQLTGEEYLQSEAVERFSIE